MRPSFLPALAVASAAQSDFPSGNYTLKFSVGVPATVAAAVLVETGPGVVGPNYILQAKPYPENQGAAFTFIPNDDIDPFVGLEFQQDGVQIGAYVNGSGGGYHDYGLASPIAAMAYSEGDLEFEYDIATETVQHGINTAYQGFFACEAQIQGENATVLSYGVPTQTETGLLAPEGCQFTIVYYGDSDTFLN